ncbi:MAG: GGDEF domain-containing protein [Planctomycetia bacterium]|nr:GGDEF domain-containing protein [Planctomycetia bacterium]
MVQVVLVVAIANLCLGYGLAIYLHDLRRPRERARTIDTSPRAEDSPEQPAGPPGSAAAPVAAAAARQVDEIPHEWLETLEGVAQSNSFAAAGLRVFKLDVARYRAELEEIDYDIRQCAESPAPEKLRRCVARLSLVNEPWLLCQREAATNLQTLHDKAPPFGGLAKRLDYALMLQAAQIETTAGNLRRLGPSPDPRACCGPLVNEVAKLIELCHLLRDRIQESLVAVLRHEDRLSALSPGALTDSLTRLYNRFALQQTLDEWQRHSGAKKHPASLGIVDLDNLRKINEAHGPLVGDRLIGAVAQVIQELTRRSRSVDRAFRFSGGSMALLVPDADPQQATAALERVRQAVEGFTFELAHQQIPARVSCAVIELAASETVDALLVRLLATLRAAKTAGRNRTFFDAGQGAVQASTAPLAIPSRTFRLDIDLAPVIQGVAPLRVHPVPTA